MNDRVGLFVAVFLFRLSLLLLPAPLLPFTTTLVVILEQEGIDEQEQHQDAQGHQPGTRQVEQGR